LPIIWHYDEIFKNVDPNKMLSYIPERQVDSARITLPSGIDINVWKERDVVCEEKEFVLQWKIDQVHDAKDPFEHVFNGPFKALTQRWCVSPNFDILINNFKFSSYVNEKSLYIQIEKFQDLFKFELDCFDDDKIKIKFNGYFIGQIQSLSYDEAKKLTNLPECVRLYARDKSEHLLIHELISLNFNKKILCDNDYINKFVNVGNSNILNCNKRNVLHHACQTNRLNIVKKTLSYGGPIQQTEDKLGRRPSDLTDNEDIIQYLKQLETRIRTNTL
jgi:hypothetical protein